MNLEKRNRNIRKILEEFDTQPELEDELLLLASRPGTMKRRARALRFYEFTRSSEHYAMLGDRRKAIVIGAPHRRRLTDRWGGRLWQLDAGLAKRRWATLATAPILGAFYAAMALANLEITREAFYAQATVGGILFAVALVAMTVLLVKRQRPAALDELAFADDGRLMKLPLLLAPVAILAIVAGAALVVALGINPIGIALVDVGMWLVFSSAVMSMIGFVTSGLRLSLAAVKPLVIGAR